MVSEQTTCSTCQSRPLSASVWQHHAGVVWELESPISRFEIMLFVQAVSWAGISEIGRDGVAGRAPKWNLLVGFHFLAIEFRIRRFHSESIFFPDLVCTRDTLLLVRKSISTDTDDVWGLHARKCCAAWKKRDSLKEVWVLTIVKSSLNCAGPDHRTNPI